MGFGSVRLESLPAEASAAPRLSADAGLFAVAAAFAACGGALGRPSAPANAAFARWEEVQKRAKNNVWRVDDDAWLCYPAPSGFPTAHPPVGGATAAAAEGVPLPRPVYKQ